MKQTAILRERVRRDIQARTDKVLRELGHPAPPLRLEDVRDLLRLDQIISPAAKMVCCSRWPAN
jgi:hypothetical protein